MKAKLNEVFVVREGPFDSVSGAKAHQVDLKKHEFPVGLTAAELQMAGEAVARYLTLGSGMNPQRKQLCQGLLKKLEKHDQEVVGHMRDLQGKQDAAKDKEIASGPENDWSDVK